MHAVLLELARPLDVVGLVKPGAQSHHGGDLLALVDRVHQGADDALIAAGAVQRHLEGEHLAVLGGVFQKFHDAVEILVGMVQQDVPLADGGEQILLAPETRGGRRHKGRVAQLRRMVALVQGHQPRGVERAVNEIQILLVQPEGFEQRVAEILGALVVNFQAHRVALAAVVQLGLHRLEQIPRFLLVNIQLAVAGDAEGPVADDFGAGEQVGEKMADQLAEKDVIAGRAGAGQRKEARQDGRTLDDGHVLEGLPALLEFQPHHQVQGFVEELGKGCAGSIASGVSTGRILEW